MKYKITTASAMNCAVVSVKIMMNPQTIAEAFSRYTDTVEKAMIAQGLTPNVSVGIYSPQEDGTTLLHLGYLLEPGETFKDTDTVGLLSLPEQKIAQHQMRGDVSGLAEVYTTLPQQLMQDGFTLSNGPRELYHHYDHANIDDSLTEIQFPIA